MSSPTLAQIVEVAKVLDIGGLVEREENAKRAIQAYDSRLKRENKNLLEALEPSGKTKYLHTGEYKFFIDCYDPDAEDQIVEREVTVPWNTVKEIMLAIKTQALKGIENEQ